MKYTVSELYILTHNHLSKMTKLDPTSKGIKSIFSVGTVILYCSHFAILSNLRSCQQRSGTRPLYRDGCACAQCVDTASGGSVFSPKYGVLDRSELFPIWHLCRGHNGAMIKTRDVSFRIALSPI